jgi:hypothetical protein
LNYILDFNRTFPIGFFYLEFFQTVFEIRKVSEAGRISDTVTFNGFLFLGNFGGKSDFFFVPKLTFVAFVFVDVQSNGTKLSPPLGLF